VKRGVESRDLKSPDYLQLNHIILSSRLQSASTRGLEKSNSVLRRRSKNTNPSVCLPVLSRERHGLFGEHGFHLKMEAAVRALKLSDVGGGKRGLNRNGTIANKGESHEGRAPHCGEGCGDALEWFKSSCAHATENRIADGSSAIACTMVDQENEVLLPHSQSLPVLEKRFERRHTEAPLHQFEVIR